MNFFVLPIFAIINRIRGGGYLPVNGKFIMTPLVCLIGYWFGLKSIIPLSGFEYADIINAVLFGASWLWWATLPWEEWINLNHAKPVQANTDWFNKLIDKLGLNDYWALALRMAIGLIPMAILFNPFWIVLAPFLVISYIFGWWIYKKINFNDPIAISELTAGLFWGIFVLLLKGN